MAIEKWLGITSVALFAMFVGEMISVYNFMIIIPEDDGFLRAFEADPKIIQFISIGVAPAGILAGVAFIMSRQYGSKPIGGMIIAGGVILLVGMYVCYSMINKIEDNYITDAVRYIPILFMALSFVVMGVGAYLTKQKKRRPKKQFF
jgi:activator of 2-hydroxyglutaryl-CoA dehydratase